MYAVVQDIPASWDRYPSVAAALDPLPEGLIVHLAGPTDEGFRTIELWESQQACRRFRDRLPDPVPGTTLAKPTLRELHAVNTVHGGKPLSQEVFE